MSKTYISVYSRIRPFISAEKDKTRWIQVRDKLVVSTPECSRDFCYKFDKVFNENSTQAEVYDQCTDLIIDALRGYNCTIFAYGQTGTGKTHTMLGIDMWNFAKDKSKSNPFVTPEDIHSTTLYQQRDLWGIIPRVLENIYNFIENNEDIECSVSCSYLEIYNEKIYDLLKCDDSRSTNSNGLEIREIKGSVYVPDAIEMNINTIEEALCLLWLGAHNRSVRATDLNNHSSRSHTLFELIITQKIKTENGGEKSIFSKINLVDLAGSEKWHPYQFGSFTDQRIQEMTSINKSLSNLGNCIRGLANNKSHIPYRNSKLTRLLQDSLGGNSKTLFIITLSPSIEYMDDGISSLQFAERAKSIEVNVNVNETYDNIELLHQYELEIERLKSILQEKIEATSNNSNHYQNIPLDMEQIVNENEKLKEENTQLKSQINKLLYIFHGSETIQQENDKCIDFNKYINIQSERMNKYLNSLSHYPPSGVLNENLTLEQRVVQAEWAVVCQRLEISKLLNKQSNFYTHTSSPSKSKSTTPIKSTPSSSTTTKLSIPSSPIPTSSSKSENTNTIKNTKRSSSTTKINSRKSSFSSTSLKKEIPIDIKFPISKKPSTIRSSSVSKNHLAASPAKNKVITPISLYGDPFVQPSKKENNIKANIWSEAVDKVTGKTYYYNIQTRETTWKKPF